MRTIKTIIITFALTWLGMQSVHAQTFEYEDFKYEVTAKVPNWVVRCVGYVGTASDVVVPASIPGIEATEYHECNITTVNWTTANSSIASLELSDGITSLAFASTTAASGLSNLETLKLSKTVTSTGYPTNASFKQYVVEEGNTAYKADDKGVLFSADGKTLRNYPKGKTDTSYTIPDGVTTIGANGIANASLTSLILPEGVTSLSNNSISGCSNLKNLTIPTTLTSISTSALQMASLRNFYVTDGNPTYASIDGVLCDNSKTKLVQFPLGRTSSPYEVPEGIETIGANAFQSAKITSIVLPESLKTIENEAFSYSQITSLKIPDAVESVGKAIGQFSYINTVHIGKNAKLTDAAFSATLRLQHITVDEDNPYYVADDDVIFNKDGTVLVFYPVRSPVREEYVIPSTVVTIGNSAFNHYGSATVKRVVVPSSVVTIESNGLSNTSINEVVFKEPSSLKTIGTGAFNGIEITEIEIPSSVTDIGFTLFTNCKQLKSFSIADNTNVRVAAGLQFIYCSNLREIKIGKNCNITGDLNLGNYYGGVYGKLESITIGDNTSISKLSCTNNPYLTTVTLGEGVSITNINDFSNNPKLESFTVPASTKSIGAFTNCTSMKSITFNTPSSVTSIGQQAFYNCSSLEEITLPKTVTSIGLGAFIHCDKLMNIYVDDPENENTKFASLDGMLTTADKKTLKAFPPGRASSDYTLIPALENIDQYAFYMCDNLTSIAIPGKVKKISKEAFWYCENLKSVTMMGREVPTLESGAMTGTPTGTLYVRRALVDDYKNAEDWAQFKDNIHPSFTANYVSAVSGRTNARDNLEYIPMSDNTVALIDDKGVEGQDEKTTLVVPVSVDEEYDGATNTYDVKIVYDDAFVNNQRVHTVSFLGEIGYVGTNAFSGSSVRDICFVGDAPALLAEDKYELSPSVYGAFAEGQNIYVKQGTADAVVEAYRSAWPAYAEQISYQIPARTNKKAATLCREFDVRLNGEGSIKAYAATSYEDLNKAEQTYRVFATSIDDGYVPAEEGVILYSKDEEQGASWYQIADEQQHGTLSDNGLLHGCYEDTWVEPSGSGYTNFVFSSGTFHRFTKAGTLSAFRSYLQLPVEYEQAKQLTLVFSEQGQVTGIVDIDAAEEADASPVYDLQGRRVAQPTGRGMYIYKGKKIIR